MELITELTPEFFTGPTGIEVDFTNIDEVGTTARERVAVNLAGVLEDGAEVVMLGPMESTQFGVNGWLQDLTDFVAESQGFDVEDFVPSVIDANSTADGFFASPFYAESSIIM